MDYDGFINKWLGKSIDWDGVYGAQCVDEVCQYLVDNGKGHCIAWSNAKDWANHPALRGDFDWTENNPSDYNQVPKRGDVIVWGGGLPGSGGYGHIAIFDMVVGPGVFQSLDQNWGGQTVHFVPNHNWSHILGWWTPKPQVVPTPPTPPAPDPAPTPAPAPLPPAVPQPDPVPVPAPGTVIEPEKPAEPAPAPTPPSNIQHYNKFLVALTAAFAVLVAALSDKVVTPAEVVQITGAFLGALGVYKVKNAK